MIIFFSLIERLYLCPVISTKEIDGMYKLYFFLFFVVLCSSCSKKYKIEGMSSVSMLDGKMLLSRYGKVIGWLLLIRLRWFTERLR